MKYHREFSFLLLQRWLQSVDKMSMFTISVICASLSTMQRKREVHSVAYFVLLKDSRKSLQ